MSGDDGRTINVGYPTVWRIERRGDEYVAVNPTTGAVWGSTDLFAVCFSIAAGGNDDEAMADWLYWLARRFESSAVGVSEDEQPETGR